ARDNPHAALAGAFAVGFLLGGGLTPRLLVSLALLAGRRYAAQIAREGGAPARPPQMDQMAARLQGGRARPRGAGGRSSSASLFFVVSPQRDRLRDRDRARATRRRACRGPLRPRSRPCPSPCWRRSGPSP